MHHPLPPRGSRALPTLLSGGLVLLPTANLWQLAALAHRPAALTRLLTTCPPGPDNRPELIFPDAETLMSWCPRIHPRLFTLLAYHRRPLTVLVPAGPRVPLTFLDGRGEVAVRLALDSFVYRLTEDLEAPLAVCHAVGAGASQLPVAFGKIRSDVLRAADHIVARRQKDVLGHQRAVCARYGAEGEIEFLL